MEKDELSIQDLQPLK